MLISRYLERLLSGELSLICVCCSLLRGGREAVGWWVVLGSTLPAGLPESRERPQLMLAGLSSASSQFYFCVKYEACMCVAPHPEV